MLDVIEHVYAGDDQAIAFTALVRLGGRLWCGLTGGRRCLVPFDLAARRFGSGVDIFPWADDGPQVVLRKIHNGMAILDEQRLVIGEGVLFGWDGIPYAFDPADAGARRIATRRKASGIPPIRPERVGPGDLARFDMRQMPGGRILIYDIHTGSVEPIGQAPPFNYIQSLTVDRRRAIAYAHTLGDCHFLAIDLGAKRVEDHGKISRFAFHNMLVAPDGIVYAAWTDSAARPKLRVLRFDPAKGFLERLDAAYLDDPGPAVQGNVGLDQWLVHSSGDIYLGTVATGTLCRFDLDRLAVQPVAQAGPGGRVTTIDEDERGRILFTGGFPLMHVARFDPATGKVEDFGPVTDHYEQVYFHGSAYVDGTLFLAETDSGVAALWEVKLPD